MHACQKQRQGVVLHSCIQDFQQDLQLTNVLSNSVKTIDLCGAQRVSVQVLKSLSKNPLKI